MPALVYAALLYKDGEIPATPESNFVQGTATEDGKLIFSFQRPDDTSGTFTLEICAFVKTEGESEDDTMQFSRETALLSGNKTGLSIVGDTIEISEAIPLSSDKPGTVSLKIKVPDECSLEIDDTANFDCKKDDLSSDTYTIVEKDGASGIATGAYQVTFTVKKDDEIVHIFSEYINVINGLCTDTWWNGEKSSEVKDVANSIAKTVYVRGTGGYYDTNSPYNQDGNAMADDEHTGSFLSPLASIQKAIDKIIAINDGTSAYTICVDGTLTATDTTYIGMNGMADFSALAKNLTLTIKTLSGTATLDGGARFTIKDDGTVTVDNAGIGKRVIHAKPESGKLNLTLENLVITGGNASDNGGGIYFSSTDGLGSLTMNGGEISGNKAAAGGGVYDDSGKFTMTAGTIGGNTATGYGGGIYFTASNTLKISSSATISGNKAKDGGEISGNTATGTGGGIYSNSGGYVEISGGTISGNKATSYGGGIYNWSAYGVKISGDAIIKKNTTGSNGGGIFINSGSLDVKGGEISGNVANSGGGGIYFSSTSHSFEISGGTIGGASDSDKNTAKNGGGVYVYAKNPKMSGGAISGNTASENGGGVYVNVTGTFTMKDGTISGNTANGNDAKKGGGGVYVVSGAFAMSDGTINGNTATNGNGAYLAAKGKLNMSGAAQFAESDDVYLYANGSDIPTITVAGALTASSQVATITPSAYTAGRQVLSAGTDMTIDDTVCGKFAVSQKGWEIAPNDDGTAGVLGISIYLNSSSGDDANSGLTASKAVKTLTKAIELFESQSAQKIMVCAEYTLPSEESTLLDRAGKEHLTLMRYIGKSDVSGAFRGKLLTISQGNVTITNVTLDGTIIGYATDELLSISGSGTEVTLGDDAIICNNSYSGVCVSSYNGKFKMTGGAITGNRTSFGGGGVEISYGTFEMSGGIISGNSGGYGGGVDIGGAKSGCKFTMSGGEISGNRAKRGAGVNVSKGLYTGTFEMSGGTISENQSYGTGDDAGGGGVYVSGKFTMSGGEITGNTATTSGGGVYVDNSGTFTMEGGKIMDNTATSKGNGVYKAENATFTHTGGTVQED
ncbi:MAG: hypothetical protein HDR34_09330 [Treponema sp.]|nr:hypothetical protein [Treponema sp.]